MSATAVKLVVILGALVLGALPPPLFLSGWGPAPPQLLIPMLVVVLAGGVLFAGWIAEVSWPIGALVGWMLLRTMLGGLATPEAMRAWWCLAVVGAFLVVYRIVATLPARADAWLIGAFLAIGLVQAVLGALDIIGKNPVIKIVMEEVQGRPHGTLYHPNHFGLYLALLMPLLMVLMRGARRPWLIVLVTLGAAVAFALVVLSRSRIPIAALGVGFVFMPWRRLGERWLGRLPGRARLQRYGWPLVWPVGALGIVLVDSLLVKLALTMNQTPLWMLGGRGLAWACAYWDMSHGPAVLVWLGRGLGAWALWALDPRGTLRSKGIPAWGIEGQNQFAGNWTEAHFEGFQAFFELGVPAVVSGLCIVGEVALDAWRSFVPQRIVYSASMTMTVTDVEPPDRTRQAWALIALTGVLASCFTPVFHHVALAMLVGVAAARARGRA